MWCNCVGSLGARKGALHDDRRYLGGVRRLILPRTVVALSIVSLLTDVSSEMIYPLVPTFLATVLGVGAMTLGAIEGTAESVAALLKYASGAWSDRMRRRKPLVVAGYLLASVARPLVGLAQGAGAVFAIRLVDRIGKGIRSAPRDAMIADAVAPTDRGRAFGFHRSADHLGAVLGPLIAFGLMQWWGVSLRGVFLAAAVPAALAMVVLVGWVRESRSRSEMASPAAERPMSNRPNAGTFESGGALAVVQLGRPFHAYVAVVLLFTLGNSTDAFLLLRAQDLGVESSLLPMLWAALHVVKTLASTPAGILSDYLGRRTLIAGGWGVYALTYLGFAVATGPLQAWTLFLVYGTFHGLTEGAEKALVADLVEPAARGRAFGMFNLALGLGALPASLVFGGVWERWGPSRAFVMGATIAATAVVLLWRVVPPRLTLTASGRVPGDGGSPR